MQTTTRDQNQADYQQVIERLWVGDITTSDGALRLVLILDFVFDWARDDYREQIIAQLNRLTALRSVRASPSLTITSFHGMRARDRSASMHYHSKQRRSPVTPADPDQTRTQHEKSERFGVQAAFAGTLLPSTEFQRIESWNEKNVSEQSEASAVTQDTEASDPLRRYDTDECAYRDAQYIRSQLMGLLITQDNIMELFHSKDTDSKSRHLLRCIVARIQSEKMALIRGEDLLAMEKAWSGNGSRQRADINESETFYTLITFSAYLNHQWDQTRELCYLAISVGALSALSVIAKSEIRSSVSQTSFEADSELIGSIVEVFQEATITANLTACLYRCSLSPNFIDVDDADNIFKSKSNLTPCSMDPHSKAKSRDLVWSIYRYHRIGRTEPSAPYLRVSSRVDAQRVTSEPTSRDTGTPWTTYNISDAVFLVYNKSPKGLPASPEWCIFFPDIEQLDKLLSDICLNDYRLCHGYQTYRLGPDPGWKITWWNHTYEKIGRDLHQTSKLHIEALRAALHHHEDSGLGDVDSELVSEVSTLGIQSDYGCEDSSHIDPTDGNDSDATETIRP